MQDVRGNSRVYNVSSTNFNVYTKMSLVFVACLFLCLFLCLSVCSFVCVFV